MAIHEFVSKKERSIITLLHVWNSLEAYFILKYFMHNTHISTCNLIYHVTYRTYYVCYTVIQWL